jgi:hypothetical protein
MIVIVVSTIVFLVALLVVLPSYIVVRDLRSGRPDPGVE